MLKISTAQELERAVSSVEHAGFTDDIECSGDIAKDVGSFFSNYQRSNEKGWIKTGGGIAAIGFAAAAVVTGGLLAVGAAAVAALAVAADSDTDRKATKRLALGEWCYELARNGYRVKHNGHRLVLLSRK